MTGKFTQNVHGLGRSAGRALRRLFFFTAGGGGVPASLGGLAQSADLASLPSSVPSALSSLFEAILALPGRYRTWWLGLLRDDPLHVLVETLLIAICVALVALQRRSDWRFSEERRRGAPTEEEEEEMLREWREERRRPLGGCGGKEGIFGGGGKMRKPRLGTVVAVERIEGNRLYFEADPDDPSSNKASASSSDSTKETGVPKRMAESAVNFATFNYLSSASSPTLRSVAQSALARYGCGSCGPRGFYGTVDAHLEVEGAVSRFLGTEGAILYSDGASAATSTVAAFAKRGDLLIVDEGVNESLLVGVMLSRANVRYFRHNDVKDLRRVLEKVRTQDIALSRKPTDQRRFLVVEGLYRNWGTLAPLKEIVELKEEFCYRLILDDSHGIGTLGQTGRGSLEHCGLKPMVHCEILTFGLDNALGSVGGMTVGSEEVVDHQRLSGAGYCFSASAPPFLSKVCVASVRRLEGESWEEIVKAMAEGNAVETEASDCSEEEDDKLIVDDMKNVELKIESKKRGLTVPGEKAELQRRLNDDLCSTAGNNSDKNSMSNLTEDLCGSALLQRLRCNVSNLYSTLTDTSHPHASKLRDRLSITSHPLSPILYLRLVDQEAMGKTRAEQTAVLDKIAHRCLVEGEVAMVSTGGHVRRYLQLVPEPSLRLVANVGQTQEDVEALVKVLGEAVEDALAPDDDGNFCNDLH